MPVVCGKDLPLEILNVSDFEVKAWEARQNRSVREGWKYWLDYFGVACRGKCLTKLTNTLSVDRAGEPKTRRFPTTQKQSSSSGSVCKASGAFIAEILLE